MYGMTHLCTLLPHDVYKLDNLDRGALIMKCFLYHFPVKSTIDVNPYIVVTLSNTPSGNVFLELICFICDPCQHLPLARIFVRNGQKYPILQNQGVHILFTALENFRVSKFKTGCPMWHMPLDSLISETNTCIPEYGLRYYQHRNNYMQFGPLSHSLSFDFNYAHASRTL